MCLSNQLLDLVVADKNHGTTSTAEDVGTSTLEECTHTLLSSDLGEAVNGAVVKLLLGTGLHHKATTHCVEGVGCDTRGGNDGLGNDELEDKVGGLEDADGRVVETEISTTVNDDTSDRDTETLVEGEEATLLHGLRDAVNETIELTVSTLANVSTKAGTGEVEGINDKEGGGAGKTAGSHVATEPGPELGLHVVLREDRLEEILEGEVEGLGREITYDVGQVATPESTNALLLGHAHEAVHDTGVTGDLAGGDTGVSILGLNEKLNTLCKRKRLVSCKDVFTTSGRNPYSKQYAPKQTSLMHDCLQQANALK